MARYIDADKIEYYRDCDGCNGGELGHCNDCTEDFVKAYRWDIDYIQAEDVAPIIHAKWIMRGGRLRCSNCDALAPLTKGWEDGCSTYTHTKTKFCSECGAKMGKE